MNGVDIHPEELIDKLAEGSLTRVERERLDAHLGQCSSCRFEITVRSDLACDAPAVVPRPQLTFTGSAGNESVASSPRERPAPQASLSVRPRARHRWPLTMLAAALVLCAGGAMAAVITGAVGGHWRPWSSATKGAEPSVGDVKPVRKVKRVADKPASAPAPSPASESNAGGVASVASRPIAAPPPLVVATPAAPTLVRGPRAAAAHVAVNHARPAETDAAATDSVAPVAPSAAEATAPRVNPAAALFADANRARRDGNLDRAVGLYRTLQSRYPSSSESELSRALLAQLLLDRGNPEAALVDFDRYLAEGTPVLSAEALVGRARALEQLGKSTQAAAAWRQVQSRFPGSVHARLAATRLAALGMR